MAVSRLLSASASASSYLRNLVYNRAFSTAHSSGVVKKLYRPEHILGGKPTAATPVSGLIVEGGPNQEWKKSFHEIFTRIVEDGRMIGGFNLYEMDEADDPTCPDKRRFLFTDAFEVETHTDTPLHNCVVHLFDA